MEPEMKYFTGKVGRKAAGAQHGRANPQNYEAREASGEPVTEEERREYLAWKKRIEEEKAKKSKAATATAS